MGVSLVYEIGDREVEVGTYILSPMTNGELHDISEEMSTTGS